MTAEQLEAAGEEQQATGKALADVGVDLGLITRERLLGLVAAHLDCEYLEQPPPSLPGDIIRLVAPEQARTYGVIPLRTAGRRLDLLAVDPFNSQIVDDLSFALGHDIRIVVADPSRVEALIRQYFGEDESSLDELLGEIQVEDFTGPEADLSIADIAAMAGQTPIVRFVNLVLAQAIRDQASDIHFAPFEHEFKIRYRIDGALYELAPPSRQLALPLTSRVKVLAGLNIAERRVPQDGRIKFTLAGRAVD